MAKQNAVEFNFSEVEWNLFTPVPGKITVNGVKNDAIASDLHSLFIARPKTAKALAAANTVIAVSKDIPDNTRYVFQFAKATGLVIEKSRTGKELKARAKLVAAYHAAMQKFEKELAALAGDIKVIHPDDPKKTVPSTGKGHKNTSVKGAGLIPSKMVPAKAAVVEVPDAAQPEAAAA